MTQICAVCGNHVETGDKFCRVCGRQLNVVPANVEAETSSKACPQCGATNLDNAVICAHCGRNFQTGMSGTSTTGAPTPLPVTGTVIPPGATVPNYLAFAVLSTILCCIPAGIPAIVYSSQVNSKLLAGDLAGAQAASRNAKLWCWISFGLGLATIGLFVLAGMLGILSSLRH
jgi:RNA polymerase subunit RPABC4/transcription elongation factor Spt4